MKHNNVLILFQIKHRKSPRALVRQTKANSIKLTAGDLKQPATNRTIKSKKVCIKPVVHTAGT